MTDISLRSLEELVSGEAFKALSPTARAEFGQALSDARTAAAEARRVTERIERENRERREAEAERRRKLLGLDLGEWVRSVPRGRRFVLAYRRGRRYVGCKFPGEHDDPRNWEPEDQYCCMDLLRGYKSPYFGYCQPGGVLDRCVREKLTRALAAKGDEELAGVVRLEFDFFDYDKADEEYDASQGGIAVASYAVDAGGRVTITGRGPMKTLKQHQEDLRKEFGNG